MDYLNLSDLKTVLYGTDDPIVNITDRSLKTNSAFISKIFYDGGIMSGSDRDYLLDTSNRPRLSAFMQGRAFTQLSNKIGIDWFLRETINRFLRNKSAFPLFDQNLDQFLTHYGCNRGNLQVYLSKIAGGTEYIIPDELRYHIRSLLSVNSIETAFSWIMLLAFWGPDSISLLSGSWNTEPENLFFPASSFSYFSSDGKEDTIFKTTENTDSSVTVDVSFTPCFLRPDIPGWASIVMIFRPPLDISGRRSLKLLFSEQLEKNGLDSICLEVKPFSDSVRDWRRTIQFTRESVPDKTCITVPLQPIDYSLLEQVAEICIVIRPTSFSNVENLNCSLSLNGLQIE